MNAIEFLKSDHTQFEKIFDEMDSTEDFFEKQDIFQKLKKTLELHAYIEETHLYPLLQDRSGFEEVMEQSFDAHQKIRDLLEQLDAMESDEEFQEEFSDLMAELIEAVQSHVETEEDDLLPLLKSSFPTEEIEQLGSVFEDAKKLSDVAA